MELIQNSAEHHFIKALDELASEGSRWYCLYFSLSKVLGHKAMISDLKAIPERLKDAQRLRDQFLAEVQVLCGASFKGYIYAFDDLDVLLICEAEKESVKAQLRDAFQTLSQKLPKGFSDISALSGNSLVHQKLADQKMLGVELQTSYRTLADAHKVSSIAARRKRRKEPLVMVVEDDRFTAHYASTIISKEFDLVLCRTAEEAIGAYIEKAPDIVFMDIHLPGLSGHDALDAISAADPDAFVVMLSVDSVKENVVKASQGGARKFLKKPFTRERIIDTVKSSPHVKALLRTTSTGHETMMS